MLGNAEIALISVPSSQSSQDPGELALHLCSIPPSFPPFPTQVLFSALLPPHSPGGQSSPCRCCCCCDPEARAALEAGWCCLEESKKINQSKGKHDGWPEAQPNKQGHGGSKHRQSTAYLVWRCQALQGCLQEGFSPESTASNSSGDGNQFLQEPENCQEDVSFVSHTSPDPGFGEFIARSEFQELPKIIIQTTPGLGREGQGYNLALIHPASGWSEPPHSLEHGGWCLLFEPNHALNQPILEEKAEEQQQPEVH